MIGVGVVGYGYWGPNLVRNFFIGTRSRVVGVSDLHPERLAQAKAHYPAIETTHDYGDLLKDTAVDLLVVATPVSTHFAIAMAALRSGRHVLVEKPFTSTSDEAKALIEEAAKRRLCIFVDHTFLYTGAVQKMKDLIVGGELGEIYYYDSVRVNLGLFQHDINVIWDLAVHDLAIMDYLIPARPVAVSATGLSHMQNGIENVAYITVFFDANIIAHVHVNWLAPVKIRRTLLGCGLKMIVYDDLDPSEKVKVYDKGITVNAKAENVYDMLVGYRMGDMWAPQVGTAEALRVEADHVVACLEDGAAPLSDGLAGLRVVRILEAATESVRRRGSLTELSVGENHSPRTVTAADGHGVR